MVMTIVVTVVLAHSLLILLLIRRYIRFTINQLLNLVHTHVTNFLNRDFGMSLL